MRSADVAKKNQEWYPRSGDCVARAGIRLSPKSRVTFEAVAEFANELPSHLAESAAEPVPECQSPLFCDVDARPQPGALHFSAGRSAKIIAGSPILAAGLNEQPAADILAVPRFSINRAII